MHLTLLDECGQCVDRAVASDMSEPRQNDRDEMKLYAAFGAGLLYASGPLPMAGAALTRALQMQNASATPNTGYGRFGA